MPCCCTRVLRRRSSKEVQGTARVGVSREAGCEGAGDRTEGEGGEGGVEGVHQVHLDVSASGTAGKEGGGGVADGGRRRSRKTV